jgi:23S rRNA (cytosine1962-C5)-methyltransferase
MKINENLKEIRIRKAKMASIERRHPWIFSGAIVSSTVGINEGELVKVLTENGKFLAIGHYQASSISVRILTFTEEEVNQDFYNKHIENAFKLRLNLNLLNSNNNIFRLIHGEGDSLPGLIIDFYNGVAVIQCHSFGMYLSLELISKALQLVLKDKLIAIYSKSSDSLNEKYQAEDKYIYGNSEVPHVALENGIKYNIDWISGQKTGFFIDQRENRSLLKKYSSNKKILNTFCYSGGFSLASIQGNANLAHSLDSSKKAIELTEQNVKLNGMEEKHKSILADTMHYIKELPEEYDIIILDPPAFAKHRDKRHNAVQAYKRLNEHAIRQIKSGGLLFTFSCSQVVDKMLFNNTIIAAAIESGRNVRIIEQLHQPADHPINAFHPEGEYLKGLVLEIN